MIQLQRAKLGLSMAGGNPLATSSLSADKKPSPVEVASAALLSEDAQIEKFINRLQRRDRKAANNHHHHHHHHHHHSDLMPASHGPTVPTALARRMLQRQGVGYLDDTVASIVSASADRFLATVLQQSIACRDQRLKGAALTREAAKQRKRHMENYEADKDDRKRRREAITKAREDIAVLTIAAAETIKKGGSGAGGGKAGAGADAAGGKKKPKKATKKNAPAKPTAPEKPDAAMEALAMEESEEEYDSLDEEEEYYQENVLEVTRERISLKRTGNDGGREDDEDEDSDDEDDTLLLRDIVRPLEAWNFHLDGKEAIETDYLDNEEIEDDEKDVPENGAGKTDPNGVSSTQQAQPNDDKAKTDHEASGGGGPNGTEDYKPQGIEKKPGEAAPNGNKNGGAKKPVAASTSSSPIKTAPVPSSS